MITFTHETATFRVLPENAQAYRAALAKPKPIKVRADRKNDSLRRDYPIAWAGMTTAEYIRCFNKLNERLELTSLEFAFADRVAPMLDPTQPEVIEEADPDYVPQVSKAKPKRTAADLRKVISQALALLAVGNVDMAQCVLNEVIE